MSAEELDALGGDPRPGEVWWCEGGALGFADGGKTRPVLVVRAEGADARVVPLTSRKPESGGMAVTHRGGLSWMTAGQPESVPRVSLISSLGPWPGFAAWQRGGGRR